MQTVKDSSVKFGTEQFVKYLMKYGGEKVGKLHNTAERWLESIKETIKVDIHDAFFLASSIGITMGLICDDPQLEETLKEIVLILQNIVMNCEKWFKEKDEKKKAEILSRLKMDLMEYALPKLEKLCFENGGHFGKKLTWLDFFFYGVIELLEVYFKIYVLEEKYPILLKLIKKIAQLPGIKEYIEEMRNK